MRKITSILLTGAVCLSLAGCSVKSPRKLFRYAQRTYGDCELIDTEESDDYTRIVVRDNLQGFEYEVVSGMYDLSIDGSSFGSVEDTRSSFNLSLECAGVLQEYNLDNRMDDWEIVVQAYHAYNEYGETGDGKQFYVCDFLYYVNDYYESEWYNTFEGTR